METNELKNSWQALDARLKKQETLNDYLIKEMLQRKYNKSLGWLSNYEWIGLIIVILVSPIVPWALFTRIIPLKLPVAWIVIYSYLFLIVLYSLFSCIWKVYTLAKFDLSKPLSDNMRTLTRYNIVIKKEMIYVNIAVLPVFYILFDSYRRVAHTWAASYVLWVVIGSIFFIIAMFILSIWIYKRFTKRHIESLRQNLTELKELEEE